MTVHILLRNTRHGEASIEGVYSTHDVAHEALVRYAAGSGGDLDDLFYADEEESVEIVKREVKDSL